MAESGKWRISEEGKYVSRLGELYFYLLGVALKVAKKNFKPLPLLGIFADGAMVGYVYKNALHMFSWPHYLRTLHAPFAFTIHMYLPDHEECYCSPKAQHTLGNIVAGNTQCMVMTGPAIRATLLLAPS